MDACLPSTGPNAISVSLSPMGCYVMVGLASRRILLHPTTDHMVAQVFRLQQPHGGETSIRVRRGDVPAPPSIYIPRFDTFTVGIFWRGPSEGACTTPGKEKREQLKETEL